MGAIGITGAEDPLEAAGFIVVIGGLKDKDLRKKRGGCHLVSQNGTYINNILPPTL